MAAAYTIESAALRCWDTVSLLVSPEVAEFCRTKSEKYGPGLSGALFGVGSWIWLDAIATSSIKIPFSQVGMPGEHQVLLGLVQHLLSIPDGPCSICQASWPSLHCL